MEHEIAVKLESLDQRTKANERRIGKIEERQDDLDKLVSSLAALTAEQEHIKEDVAEIKTDVKTLTEKPAKHWEGLVSNIIWAVGAAVVAFILARIGLS